MAKVLVVRKPDRTIHQMPLANKAAAMAYSNRLPAGAKWKFEEVEESEAAELPYFDKNYLTTDNANVKLKAKDKELAEKDKQLADLQAQLEALKAAQSNPAEDDPGSEEEDPGDTAKETASKKTAPRKTAKKSAK